MISSRRCESALTLLRVGLCALALVFGLDKFRHFLTVWRYPIAPDLMRWIPFSASTLFWLAGIAEIILALVILVAPRIGAWLTVVWLGASLLNLVFLGEHWDMVLRTFALVLAALALAELAHDEESIAVIRRRFLRKRPRSTRTDTLASLTND
jgi:hypothetical protein